ncbi:hypothetical protein NET02_05400 [Thermomicrobiaceae bacterium CFH 74404]|uniref:Uncharacterized protein n=2 Tax=Thermomicrobia TaxID=189775 RepID=A0AA42BAH1_9BACT|nr:hypothetical protein [Thermalbibacter longus]MCM8748574.1 hypothetical protein [Thermalbibacter longus]
MATVSGSPSFARDIQPLFRDKDRESMRFLFDLHSYEDVAAHASEILEELEEGEMPCDGPWPPEQIELFRRWVDEGMAP